MIRRGNYYKEQLIAGLAVQVKLLSLISAFTLSMRALIQPPVTGRQSFPLTAVGVGSSLCKVPLEETEKEMEIAVFLS